MLNSLSDCDCVKVAVSHETKRDIDAVIDLLRRHSENGRIVNDS